jgi:hypothetical protein
MGAAARGREVHPLAFHTVSRGRSKRGDVHHHLLSFFVGWATFCSLLLALPLNVTIGKIVVAANRIYALPGPVPSL